MVIRILMWGFSEGQIVAGLRFLQKIFTSALGWFAAFLNRRSREHRYVAYVLGKEKEKLKERLKQVPVLL